MKQYMLTILLLLTRVSFAFLLPDALDPGHITATPSGGTPDRNNQISGEWAFSLYAVLAVNGSGLDGLGRHGTTDTGTMYMDDNGVITSLHPAGLNGSYRAYVNAMFDDIYFIEGLHIWNFNAPSPARGFHNVDIHGSDNDGQSYVLLGGFQFDMAPGTSDYTGFYVDIPDRWYTDIVISAVDNHGDGSWIGIAEVQFIQGIPQPGPARLVLPYNNGQSYPQGSLSWQEGLLGPFSSYDVYLGRSYDAVYNARNITCESLFTDYLADCYIDILDLQILARLWLNPHTFNDFAFLGSEWQQAGWPEYKVNQTATSYDFTGLEPGTWYWRIDEYKAGAPHPIQGDIWNFEVVPRAFFNMLGWAELNQYQYGLRDDYAQDVAFMGIRQAMDRNSTITFYEDAGVQTAFYHDVMSKSGFNPFPDAIVTDVIAGYKHHPFNWGYYMFDEPKDGTSTSSVRKEMWQVDQAHDTAGAADPARPSLTTLYSSHGATDIYGYLDSYFNQVDQIPILCYDHYPFRYGITGSRGHWRNLEIFRARSLTEGIPLFCWSETNQGGGTGTYVGSTTNKNRMRWSNYSRLAYGVKGIAWWGYTRIFQPSSDNYGNRTYTIGPAFADVQEINAELNRVGNVMVNLTSTAVYHKNRPDIYTTELPGDYRIQLSNHDLVLGMFVDDGGTDYALVCNRTLSGSAPPTTGLTATVTFKEQVSSVSVYNEQAGTWDALTLEGVYPNQYVNIYLGPGYGKLLRIIKSGIPMSTFNTNNSRD